MGNLMDVMSCQHFQNVILLLLISCTYDLGRKGVMDDEDRLPLADTFSNRNVFPTTKKKKSFSDPEDSSDDFIKCASSLKHSHNTDCCSPCHSYASSSPPISCRILTQELRKQKRSNAERNCDICRQPMLPGKDVATLLNLKTGRLACSSRNINGAFHLFHASCLIHWILLCEFEMWAKQMVTSRGTRGRKRKSILKSHDFPSVFCPECQGTGICVEGDELQQPNVALSETFIYKLKAIKAHKQWMKNPEALHKCSTGLSLSIDSESMLKLQHVNHALVTSSRNASYLKPKCLYGSIIISVIVHIKSCLTMWRHNMLNNDKKHKCQKLV
ncbi:hypothetical protein HPP92_027303 [Vanilla planifolia]|uniref:Uncharacterized protein n=1 Tax=Vanilla planifolia TaxID=51239 RepID=A0A835U5Y7_VANPL|nr:hypothetical protein HPP92_027303 [Vanilla planifolia]